MRTEEKLNLRRDKYVVAEATRLEVERLKIKSAVSGLSVHDYVNQAIKDHSIEKIIKVRKCHECHSNLELRYYNDLEKVDFNGKFHEINLLNIPYAECPKCEKELVTLRAGVGIERITHLLFQKRLQETRGKELLEAINFKEILF